VKRLLALGLLILTIVLSYAWPHISSASVSNSSVLMVKPSSSSNEIANLGASVILTARGKVQSTDNINSNIAIRIPRTGKSNNLPGRSGVISASVSRSSGGIPRAVKPRAGRYRVVGNRSLSGRFEPLTPKSLDSMFSREQRSGGLITLQKSSEKDQRYLVSSPTNSTFDFCSYRVNDESMENDKVCPTFTLIAVDEDYNELVELHNIGANYFCVDALNAVIQDELVSPDYDLESLDI
jgi:hypothetical protein